MRHNQVMQNICDEWLVTARNLDILERNFGKSSKSYQGQRTRLKKLERVITAHGFMYLVTGRINETQRDLTVMFRPKRVTKYNTVLKNWLTKTNRQHWTETQMANLPFDTND
jgi:hypothetical protein